MKKTGLLLSAVLCLALSAQAVAAEDVDYTVGDFAVGLAELVTGRPDYTVEDAVTMLRGMGYDVSDDLQANLKEQEFVDLLNQYGLQLRSTNPGQAVTPDQAKTVLGLFGANSAAEATDCPPGFPGSSCNALKCVGGANDEAKCSIDADCPDGFCRTPPGIAKKLASP